MSTLKYVSLDKLSHFLLLLKTLIPTKTSDLTNDSNFVVDANYTHIDENFTSAEKTKLQGIEVQANNYSLPTASSTTLGGVKIGSNITIDSNGAIDVTALEWSNVNGKPTKLSDFTNDSNFITNTVNDLTNYYTKTNSYTKEEVNTLIGNLSTIQIEIVSELPATGESNKIYLVPNSGAAPNAHDEYIWTNNSFELIGSTEVDITNCWSKTELKECTNEEIEALFTA